MDGRATNDGRTFLEDLSRELSSFSARLAVYAEQRSDLHQRAARERVTAAQVRAAVAARHARSEVFGIDLADPGWSLLLELFRAYLEKRTVRLPRLVADARVAATTASRWIETFADAGFVHREPDPQRRGAITLALTDAAKEAMEDYFVAIQIGLGMCDPP